MHVIYTIYYTYMNIYSTIYHHNHNVLCIIIFMVTKSQSPHFLRHNLYKMLCNMKYAFLKLILNRVNIKYIYSRLSIIEKLTIRIY